MSKEGALPSYEESTNAHLQAQYYTSSTSDGQRIRDRVRAVREEQIASVINEHVYPLISQQAMYGIGSITIALMPSDVVLAQEERVKSEFDFEISEESRVEIIGFPEQLQQIQLDGHMNRLDFWKQQGVVEELERALNENLDASSQSSITARNLQPPLPQRPTTKGFFGRKSSSATPETAGPGNKSGLLQREKNTSKLTARLEDICLRTVSSFGLYETTTRQSIIIKFSAGC
ncbi:uncharacterized protein BDZ99DRAFT_65820 [Mytilinidion resinicola]|uniref:Uncharacterized protein n=1 Tax=Mytilinidion resinicola TaxID=574789 RepID=A0A6A6YGQ5_9PEZI|nr:uncharacterized protein BDZ99DRAFT_65820 [Mytilinidion resinicola]KAF2807779.1 hypothetical protein BDZ99DRAFT_65820 [Mytilinidion resinicola]